MADKLLMAHMLIGKLAGEILDLREQLRSEPATTTTTRSDMERHYAGVETDPDVRWSNCKGHPRSSALCEHLLYLDGINGTPGWLDTDLIDTLGLYLDSYFEGLDKNGGVE